MKILDNLKLDVYFMAIIYMSFILLVFSLFGPDIKAFSSKDIASFSLCWLSIGLILWLLNDMLGLHSRAVDREHEKGNTVWIDKLGIGWTIFIALVHFVLFGVGFWCSFNILNNA